VGKKKKERITEEPGLDVNKGEGISVDDHKIQPERRGGFGRGTVRIDAMKGLQ